MRPSRVGRTNGHVEDTPEYQRGVQFTRFACHLVQRVEVALGGSPSRPDSAELFPEPHFHFGHDDLRFAVRIGRHELRVDACQGRVRIAAGADGIVEERLLEAEQLTAAEARAEVLAVVDTALSNCRGFATVSFCWLPHPDPPVRRA